MIDVRFRSDFTVELQQALATDEMVSRAARISTGSENASSTERLHGLVNYLMKHRHGSPFEHNMMTFRVEAPIFVAREWMRHRIGVSINEWSGRYDTLEPVCYLPLSVRPLVQSGSSAHPELVAGTDEQMEALQTATENTFIEAYERYLRLLEAGIAREVARNVLPVSIYTKYYFTCNARSLMAFLSLRTDRPESTFPSKPQWEIARCAELMEAEFARLMPITADAFNRNGRVAP